MHLPDGFINNQISVGFIAIAISFLTASFVKLKKSITEKVLGQKLALADGLTSESSLNQQTIISQSGRKKADLMAMLGALIFALQMVNFPVVNGTSGHLIGGVLLAVTLGPWAGIIVISAILICQSLIFADGGILALGANIFNMGIVAGLGGYYLYRFGLRLNLPKLAAVAITSWLSVPLAALACSLQIGFSGTVAFALVVPAMLKIHVLIGLGEAVITLMIIKFLKLELYEK
jgi:cobalt/nickel transport system permease protein